MKPVSRIVFIYAVDLGYNTPFGFRMDRTLPPPGGRGAEGPLSTNFVLMMDAPGSPAPSLMWPTVDIFCVDGGHSRISNSASHGACRRRCLPSTCFTLMVGAPGSPALPPKGPTVDVFYVDDGRSRISDTASQGPTIDVFKIGGGRCRISNNASQGAAIDVFKTGGGRSQNSGTASQGPRHQRIQDRWWAFPDLQHHLPGGHH
jgi:hypothetical protein